MVRVADYIMQTLHSKGVEHLFMLTGRGVLYLSDAAAKEEGLKPVPMHHEQACAYAAYAYAAYNGTLGACLVSTGCASTNAITGVLCAWQDGVPCVVVSGQNTLRETTRYTNMPLRTWGQQETDIISLVEPITKYAVMLTDPKRAVYELEKALHLACTGHRGPVWIDVPLDIQNARIEPEQMEHFVPETEVPPSGLEDVRKTAELLRAASRPVILIGSGVRWAGAAEELKRFVDRNQIPVAYSASMPDVFDYSEPLCVGSVGMMACSRSGCFAVQNSDVLLVIGNRLSPMTTGPEYGKFARKAKTVVVDIDENEHSKHTVPIDRFIKADARAFLAELNRQEIDGDYTAWREKCAHWKQAFPLCEAPYMQPQGGKTDLYELAKALSVVLPEDCVFLCDAGLEELILPSNVVFSNGRRCIHPYSQGTMGFALPAAAGAYYASGGRPTVAVIGDGSAMMNVQELATIAYNRLPIKILIVENGAYSVIRTRQAELFRTRTVGTDAGNGVPEVSFEKLADCFDIPYVLMESNRCLQENLLELFRRESPVICEIRGLEDQGYLACAYARTAERRFVRRPLEDQAPFLDRNVFLSEMVIDPIDQ